MKKLIGLAAASVAAALALTACSNGSASTASPSASVDNSKRTITLWLAGGIAYILRQSTRILSLRRLIQTQGTRDAALIEKVAATAIDR